MRCFVCESNWIGFIGDDCDCGEDEPDVIENGVVSNGIQVTVNGVNVVNNGA